MKKSTLITTIAMIVVVVVALSTATYAWFSAGTDTTVSGTMSTAAQQGWLIYGATVGSATTTAGDTYGNTDIDFTGTDDISLNLMDDLYAPYGTFTATFTETNNQTTYKQMPFHKAEQEGAGVALTATAGTPAFVHGLSDAKNINAMRIFNGNSTGSATADDLELTIYVTIPATPTNAQYIAARRFSTYIVTSDGDNFHTRYYYTSSISESVATRYSTIVDKSATGVTYSQYSSKTIEDNGASVSQGFTPVSEAAGLELPDGTTLAQNSAYYTITVSLGSVTRGEALDIIFYAWFDGWALDNTAGTNQSVGILYSFATAA